MSNSDQSLGRHNSQGFFITGTDTDCGKTHVSSALIAHLARNGKGVAGLKPIASGFELSDGQWRNHDIDSITQASSVKLPEDLVNRYAYKEPIAPHIAANAAGDSIEVAKIVSDVKKAQEIADVVIVEGVGGWLVPLDLSYSSSIESLAVAIDLPVVLVVGLRLGCLNHALLSVQAIKASSARFAGWVANHVDPNFQNVAENIATLKHAISEPLLFELEHCPSSQSPQALKNVSLDQNAAFTLS